MDAIPVADRLLASLNQPYQLGNQKVVSTASIGIVLGDASYHCADDVLRDADIAMYEAKRQGKGRYVIFDDSLGLTDKRGQDTIPAQSLAIVSNDQPIVVPQNETI